MASILQFISDEQAAEIIERLDRIEGLIKQSGEVKVYSPSEVAEKLGVTRNTVYAWAKEGKLRSFRTGGKVLIPSTAINELLGGNNVSQTTKG